MSASGVVRAGEHESKDSNGSPSLAPPTERRYVPLPNESGKISWQVQKAASPVVDMELSLYFDELRHSEYLLALVETLKQGTVAKWRMQERMKTVSVALILCLNLGVDPPDVVKTNPCAREECWVDPLTMPPQKAVESIGKNLQAQYDRWQPRARYKASLDPTVDDVKKLCVGLRRNAKEERVLIHYNGHGVPRPTSNGEIWMFNKNYTQYIPLSVYDLQTWVGTPALFVFDCSAAGLIVNAFMQFIEQREKSFDRVLAKPAPGTQSFRECIILAACGANQLLPMNPEFPADVFTACLTTPIKIALRWACSRSVLAKVSPDLIDKIPGRTNDRKTPLGELNWIFTAITDTIAWNMMPHDLFQKLFRQDLLVASLFRNFLLAERIMRSANCMPVSYPQLPSTYQHHMWQAWDLAADLCLAQLPDLLKEPNREFRPSPFFAEQLTAFERWLECGSESKRPPEQLPIVLQVLLSQVHRLRALELLGRFLDMGPWAVNLALSVGIFPYVLKLLQSPSTELRSILVFIWAKILALDKSCQTDLVNHSGHVYFVNFFNCSTVPSDQRAMAAFVLTVIMSNYRPGQNACLSQNLFLICLNQINDPDPLLRRWIALCIAKFWEGFDEAKWCAIRENAPEIVCGLLVDSVCEVRAAAVYALGTFIGGSDGNEQRIAIEMSLGVRLSGLLTDGSPVVRTELALALGKLVSGHVDVFRVVATEMSHEKKKDKKKSATPDSFEIPVSGATASVMNSHGASVQRIWKCVLSLVMDSYSLVADSASHILRTVNLSYSDVVGGKSSMRRVSSLLSLHNASMSLVEGISGFPLKKAPSMDFHQVPGHKRSDGEDSDGGGSSRKVSTTGKRDTRSGSQSDGQSNFYSWSCLHFSRPLLKAAPPQKKEPVPARNHRLEKHKRIQDRAATLQQISERRKLDDQIAILDNETEMASLLLFHPYESLLVVSDEKDLISVWNYQADKQTVKSKMFSNQNVQSTRITSLNFVNEMDSAMLMTGSDDGIVRVWSDCWDSTRSERLVTSWKALPDLTPGSRGPGLVSAWQQEHGRLLVTGNVLVVRVWDMNSEQCIQEIPTGTDSCITSVSSDGRNGNYLYAGCGDGSVRLFDLRLPAPDSLVMTFDEHRTWVVNVHKQRGEGYANQVVSGSVNGDIKFWDIRHSNSAKTIEAHRSTMTALAVHDYAPIIASGSHNQFIKVFNTMGETLSMIRYHDGFLGQRIGPVSCLSFHQHRLLLAAGATDSIISIYAGEPLNVV